MDVVSFFVFCDHASGFVETKRRENGRRRGGGVRATRSVGCSVLVVINYVGMRTGTRRRMDDLDVATRGLPRRAAYVSEGRGFRLGRSVWVYFSSLDVMRMRWEPNWVFTGPKT